MQKIQSRAAILACLATLLFVPQAFAFETVDTIPWPSLGRFPAYPVELARPTDVFAEVGVMRDDNILGRQNNRAGDSIGRVGAGVRHVQRIVGRESLLLDARIAGYGYANFDDLSHIAYSLAGTWLWEATNDLTGSVIAARDWRLVGIGERQAAERDIVTGTRLAAPLVWRVGPSFRLSGGPDFGWAESDRRPHARLRTSTYRAGAGYIRRLAKTL